MKKTALLTVALGIWGCAPANSDDGLMGIWKGKTAGLEITVEVSQAYPQAGGGSVVQGVLSTSNPRCLRNATMVGSLTKTTVQFLAHGAGTVSTDTSVQIDGELEEDKITGLLGLDGEFGVDECSIDKAPLTLVR